MMKEKEIFKDANVLNIPSKLAKACLDNEDMLSLLLFSTIIKHYSLDSRLTNLKTNFIRDLLGCSKTKACRVLELAKKNKIQ